MRAIVTRLMDKGKKTRTRSMPIICDMQFGADDAGRPALIMASVEKSAVPVMGQLLHPQLASIGKRSLTMHGYELDRVSGQLFGQAWDIEPERR
jgi:hypothetical protein